LRSASPKSEEEARIAKLKGTAESGAMQSYLMSKEYRLRNAKEGFRNMLTILRGMEVVENQKNAKNGIGGYRSRLALVP